MRSEVDSQLIPMREGVSPVVVRSREAESFVMLNGSRNIGHNKDRLDADDTDRYVGSLPALVGASKPGALPRADCASIPRAFGSCDADRSTAQGTTT
jgi:hypothetical protein